MKPPKILIVDDDEDLRRMLRGALSPVCDVLEASNGLDALCLLQRERPRLMLLDMVMPEMDGLEVLSAARRAAPGTRVVMLTGDDDVDSAVAALDLGASAYITKPFDPAGLRDEVVRMVQPPAKDGDAPWQVRGEG
ncbi:MAG: response regulator [Elusimicrobiota bacterium]